jgi:protein-tyrosine kinase
MTARSVTRSRPSERQTARALRAPAGGRPPALAASIVMVSEPLGDQAEAIRALRTHLVAQHVNEGRRALAVCAASPGVGCTFVAVNLAVAFSQIGLNTLFIDGDLRHPSASLTSAPTRNAATGLVSYLDYSRENIGGGLELDVLPNLSVMYAGGTAANPQELLAGSRFAHLIDFCLRQFDLTIIDTPPANSSSDARLIGSVVGYALIVAKRDESFVSDIKTLSDQLRSDGVRVVGSVLNDS